MLGPFLVAIKCQFLPYLTVGIYGLLHRSLMYIANLVKASGSNPGKCKLLLETEKNSFFHKLSLIAESENCACFHIDIDMEKISLHRDEAGRLLANK